jgi:predicted ester cyclase
MSIEENKTLVRRLIEEVWNTSDYRQLEMVAAPSFAESTKQGNQSIRIAFPDHTNTIEDMIAEGDKVAVRWTLRGTHQGVLKGPLGPIPPTGNQVAVTGIHIFRIADGKITERWEEADMLGALQQLGAIPTPQG